MKYNPHRYKIITEKTSQTWPLALWHKQYVSRRSVTCDTHYDSMCIWYPVVVHWPHFPMNVLPFALHHNLFCSVSLSIFISCSSECCHVAAKSEDYMWPEWSSLIRGGWSLKIISRKVFCGCWLLVILDLLYLGVFYLGKQSEYTFNFYTMFSLY